MHQEERQVGSYRLHKHIEHGIIADAYLAAHIPTNKQVIVKVFQETMSGEQLAACIAYVRACAHLEHPNILRLLDFGQEGSKADTSTFFLATDVPGETLRQRHPPGLPLPLDTISLYVSQIADALQFAHNRHVLHRNLSPEQLFIGPDGRIMLDYTNRLLSSTIPIDTLYVPHEAPDAASDQYALAMIIYEWLSGTLPVNDPGSIGKQRILSMPGEYVSAIWPRIEKILSRALAPDPAQRYENVEAFADEFILALNVGPEAVRRRQERLRQASSGGSTTFTRRVAGSITTGFQQTAARLPNPFSSGLIFPMRNIGRLAFSPDGQRLAFNSGEPAIYIAQIVEQKDALFTYQGHTDSVGALAWSPDGQSIASASSNGTTHTIQIWEATTGELLATYSTPSFTREIQWSPDGRCIATGGWESTVYVWQSLTGNPLLTYSAHTSSISSLAWSPDGTRLASASSGEIHVWEIATGALVCTYRGHMGAVNAAAWSPDGTMIASGGDDTTLQIWNATTRAPISIHRLFASSITAIGWSPDGTYVIVGTRDNDIQIYAIKDGTSVFHYRATLIHAPHSMGCVAWSPDLSILAIGGDDRRVEIANRSSGKLLLCRAPAALIEEVGQGNVTQGETTTTTSSTSVTTGQTTTVTATTVTTVPPGPPVVRTTTRQHRTVNVWGGKDAIIVTYVGHRSAVKPLAWSLDSSRIASGGYDGSVHVWDAAMSTTIFIYRGHLDPVTVVAWSPDGTRLASGSLDHSVKIWDLLTGREILTYRGHNDFVQALTWSPDSTRVASGGKDNTVQVWDAGSGETILTYNEHTDAINAVDWSVDGQYIASAGDDQTVHIWAAATGNTVFVYRNHVVAVLAVAWSPDGKRIASSSARTWRGHRDNVHTSDNEARLHIWTADQTPAIYGQDEHRGAHDNMSSITWSPDGQMIAAEDNLDPQIYDASTGELMAVIASPRQPGIQLDTLLNVSWSPDGTRIAGSLSNGRVRVWPAHP